MQLDRIALVPQPSKQPWFPEHLIRHRLEYIHKFVVLARGSARGLYSRVWAHKQSYKDRVWEASITLKHINLLN